MKVDYNPATNLELLLVLFIDFWFLFGRPLGKPRSPRRYLFIEQYNIRPISGD